jgi:hypothetical protein
MSPPRQAVFLRPPAIPFPASENVLMSDPSMPSRRGRAAWLLLPLLLTSGAEPPTGLEPRLPEAVCQSAAGTLLSRERPGRPWRALAPGDPVHSRDLLLALPGVKAAVETQPGSVGLTLLGNLPELSSFLGLESAVVLHDSRAFDLDLSLLRGRVVLANRKAKGPARVWVRVPDGGGEITFPGPGDEVALEVYGLWPRGVPFTREPRPSDRPTFLLAVLVLKGQVDFQIDGIRHRLTAPPGPASFLWDSVHGPEEGPRNLDRLPSWADPKARPPAPAKLLAGVLESFQSEVARRSPDEALVHLLAAGRTPQAPSARDGTEAERRRLTSEFAVLGLTALGEVSRVAETLADPDPAARAAAVLGLRHWIGQAAGRDPQLYQLFIDRLHYTRVQAETVLQLLHNPFAADQPETYETLIAYLNHSKPAIRELAWWHLSRLVAAGVAPPYDPSAPEAERARAVAVWKKLIPSGSLPPREKTKDK